MLRRIFNILRGIHPPPLGRWCLKDKSKNNWKIDTANTDNCGTCSYENAKRPVIMKNEYMLISPNKKHGECMK
jgi:hypothetical protein